jgi:hypothetical protein
VGRHTSQKTLKTGGLRATPWWVGGWEEKEMLKGGLGHKIKARKMLLSYRMAVV